MTAGIALGAVLAALGCATPRPYETRDNWVVVQNAVPQYFAHYDVFYVYPPSPQASDWLSKKSAIAIYDDVKHRFQSKFGKKVRFFAPFVREASAADDAALALRHYLTHYHDANRPFLVMVEGRDEAFVSRFRKAAKDALVQKSGFVGLIDEACIRVDGERLRRIGDAVRHRRLAATWGDGVAEEVL